VASTEARATAHAALRATATLGRCGVATAAGLDVLTQPQETIKNPSEGTPG